MRTFALLATLCALCVHAEVYKWVDEKGKTQYGEFPPAGAKATKMNAPSGPADGPAPAPQKGKAEGPKVPEKEGAERCAFERQQQQILNGNADVIYKNDKGAMVPMDEAKRNSAKILVAENVKKYCP